MFIADLHIHSKYSRATAKNLDIENLYIAAQLKGITVVATGDFTHPEWFAELQEKLVPAENGLFKLKNDISEKCDREVPAACRSDVRFILVSEISNIYKKNEKTRKNHNLVFVPDFHTAQAFNDKLDIIGNIKSDGRPILGLDARNLLEILLETSEDACLIPAHIWTPWFSMFGSKSGFDSIEDCFADLSSHIFAVETGLSSDPAMNWRVSQLDGLTLVSNSDAHSPSKLGREANLFNTEMSYDAIFDALKTGDPERFLGTFEFYPEEGKYHMDGHRKCDICLSPEETAAYKGICPKCHKPLTVGVLNRVGELADRPDGAKPERHHPYYSIIPLDEILSEILRVGPKSKKVTHAYASAISNLGSEFNILHHMSTDAIENAGLPMLGEAVSRMRSHTIHVSPGYDGEFGKIKIFNDTEREELLAQKSLFIMPPEDSKKNAAPKKPVQKKTQLKTTIPAAAAKPDERSPAGKAVDVASLNPEQQKAVKHTGSPLLIVAGPGTGKTLTLTQRIAHLIKEHLVSPQNVLAVTFTNKAAREMNDRLKRLLTDENPLPFVATFHSLCLHILKDVSDHDDFTIIDDETRAALVSEAIGMISHDKEPAVLKTRDIIDLIVSAKQQILKPDNNLETLTQKSPVDPAILSETYRTYQNLLSFQNLYDFEDLIFNMVTLLETDHDFRQKYQKRFKYVFVDEYQDLNQGQYRIIRALAPENTDLCVIGDPDQSIYGFRGSDVRYFNTFVEDYPDAAVIHLTQNYRSTETILEASYQIIKHQTMNIAGTRTYSTIDGLKQIVIRELPSEKSEAVDIGTTIENLIGGMGFYTIDFDKTDTTSSARQYSFGDFAVLFRTKRQSAVLADIFDKAGIPCQVVSRENMYEQKAIASLLSMLSIINKSGTFIDLEKIARLNGAGIGKKTIERLKSWCYQNAASVNDMLAKENLDLLNSLSKTQAQKTDHFRNYISELKYKINELSVENRLLYLMDTIAPIKKAIMKNVKTKAAFNRLIHFSENFDGTVSDFLRAISLQTDTDIYDEQSESVSLMTMHAAKGLEFPVVFIAGCEKDFLPYRHSASAPCDIDEEKRLFYVAMTRAKECLYLTCAKKRTVYGRLISRKISPFVADIEKQLIDYKAVAEKKGASSNKEGQVQLKLF